VKVYQARGKRPLEEIEHIKALLGDLWRGYHAYDPEHPEQDATIVLRLLSRDEEEQQRQEYANDVRPSLLSRRWTEVAEILRRNGYEVEEL